MTMRCYPMLSHEKTHERKTCLITRWSEEAFSFGKHIISFDVWRRAALWIPFVLFSFHGSLALCPFTGVNVLRFSWWLSCSWLIDSNPPPSFVFSLIRAHSLVTDEWFWINERSSHAIATTTTDRLSRISTSCTRNVSIIYQSVFHFHRKLLSRLFSSPLGTLSIDRDVLCAFVLGSLSICNLRSDGKAIAKLYNEPKRKLITPHAESEWFFRDSWREEKKSEDAMR